MNLLKTRQSTFFKFLGTVFLLSSLELFLYSEFQFHSPKIVTPNTQQLPLDLDNDQTNEIVFSGNGVMSINSTLQNQLNLNGSMGLGMELVSGNTILSDNSMVLVDTSAISGNITLTLPDPTTVPGRKFFIKKISPLNGIILSGNIDSALETRLSYAANLLPSIEIISDGTQYFVLDITKGVYLIGQESIRILSIVADDPDNLNHLLDSGDTLTLTFSDTTSQPSVQNKNEIDRLIYFGGYSLGSSYSGNWISSNILKITINDATGATLPIGSELTSKGEIDGGIKSNSNPYYQINKSANLSGDYGYNLELNGHQALTQPLTHSLPNYISAKSNYEFLSFKLLPNGTPQANVTQLDLNLSSINTFNNTNVASANIFIDSNNNGVIDGSEMIQVGGASSVDINSNQKISFTDDFLVSSSGNNFIVKINLQNMTGLPQGDVATFTLNSSSLSANLVVIGSQLVTTFIIDDVSHDGEIVLGSNTVSAQYPKVLSYDYSASSFSSITNTIAANANFHFMDFELSPSGNGVKMLATFSDNTIATDLELHDFNGEIWSQSWVTSNISLANSDKKGYDIAYESFSGHGLAVYSIGTNILVYRSSVNGAWASAANVMTVTSGIGVIEWVELYTHPFKNEITLLYSDANFYLYACVWNGLSWGSVVTLETDLRNVSGVNYRIFDGAYESLNGDFVCAWGKNGVLGLTFSSRVNGSASFNSSATYNFTNNQTPIFMDLEADPGSDKIACAFWTNATMQAAMWNGTSWGDGRYLDGDIGSTTDNPNGTFPLALGWLTNASKAVLIHTNNLASGIISHAEWDNGWSIKNQLGAGGLGSIHSIKTYSFPGLNRVMALLLDESKKLYVAFHDGTTWGLGNSNNELVSEISASYAPFDAYIYEKGMLLLSDHIQGQVDSLFTGASTVSTAELFAFRIRPSDNSQITVNQIQFDLTDVVGVSASDIQNLEIRYDVNNDGLIGVGETAKIAASGTVSNLITGKGTITFTSSIPFSSDNTYILVADLANCENGDQFGVSLSQNKVTGSSIAVSGVTTSSSHYQGSKSPSDNDDVRFVYGISSGFVDKPSTRLYDVSANTLSAQFSTTSANSTIFTLKHELSPSSNQELMLSFAKGSEMHLDLLTFDGAEWTKTFTAGNIAVTDAERAPFDICYPALSSNALIVYSNGDENPRFRFLDNGVWTAEANVFTSAPGTATVKWMRLEAQPASEKIALVYSDDNDHLMSVIWNGNVWLENQTEEMLSTSLELDSRRPFDLAWESFKGDLLVVWGATAGDGFYYNTLSGNSLAWQGNSVHTYTNDNNPRYLVCESDINSNRIAIASLQNDNHLHGAMWDGSSLYDGERIRNTNTTTNGTGDINMDVAWLGYQNEAIVVFNEAGAQNTIRWAKWQPGTTWQYQSQYVFSGIDSQQSIKLNTAIQSSQVFALISDVNAKLFAARYNGLTWNKINAGVELTDLSTTDTRAFDISINQAPVFLLDNHRSGVTQDNFISTGTVDNMELLKFQIKAFEGGGNQINSLSFTLDGVEGLNNSNWSDLRITKDNNHNGIIDGGEVTTLTGNTVVSISGSSGTITFTGNLMVSGNDQLILAGNVNNLQAGDVMGIGLSKENISSEGDCLVLGSVSSVIHVSGVLNTDVPGSVRLSYSSADAPLNTVRSRIWKPADNTLSAQIFNPTGNTEAKWITNKFQPSGNQELIVTQGTLGTIEVIEAYRFDGANWNYDWSEQGASINDRSKKCFDLAYSQFSGNALVVYSNNSTDLQFKSFNGNSWSSAANVFTTTLNTGVAQWVRLVEKPGSNEIALVYSDSNSDLFACVWDGNQWKESNAYQQLTLTLEIITERSFDCAYESIGDELLVVWGQNTDGINYARYTSSTNTWSDNLSHTYASDSDIRSVNISPSPSSDKIAIAMRQEDSYLHLSMWNGSSFTDSVRLDYMYRTGAFTGLSPIHVGWRANSNEAIAVYDDSAGADTIHWARWQEGVGWQLRTDQSWSGLGTVLSYQSDSIVLHDQVLFSFLNDQGELRVATFYDGLFTPVQSGSALEDNLSSLASVPHGVSVRQPTLWYLSNHELGLQENSLIGALSADNLELYRIKFKPRTSDNIQITSMKFELSELSDIDGSDITNVNLIYDQNENGRYDNSDSVVLSNGSVSVSGSLGNIQFNGNLLLNTESNFILSANLNNLGATDSLSIKLNRDGIKTSSSNSVVYGEADKSTHLNRTFSPQSFSEARLVYATSIPSADKPKTRIWQNATSDWSSESTAGSASSPIQWIRHAISSANTNEEHMMTASNGGTSVSMQRWNGFSWVTAWQATTSATGLQNYNTIDLAYEQLSGNTVAVYSDGNNNPLYRYYNGSSWGVEQNVFSTAPGTGVILWVRVEPKPASNEITLVYLDNAYDLHAVIWDGSSFVDATKTTLDTTVDYYLYRDFDLAYESISRDLLVVWTKANTDGFSYVTKSANTMSFSSVSNYAYLNDNEPRYYKLVPNPNNDYIGVLSYSDGNYAEMGMWNGSSFIEGVRLDYMYGASYPYSDDMLNASWIVGSNELICVYNDAHAENALNWLKWDAANGWVIKNDVLANGISSTQSIATDSFYLQDKALFVFSDGSEKLQAFTYENDSWTNTTSSNVLTNAISSIRGVPFSLSVLNPQKLILTDHQAGSRQDTFSESGSETNVSLFSFSLRKASGSNIAVNQVVFTISNLNGIVDADINGIQLYEDLDFDGVLDGGEPSLLGNGNVQLQSSSGNISFSGSFTVSENNQYLLVGNILNLATDDLLTLQLQPSGIGLTSSNIVCFGQSSQSTHLEGLVQPVDNGDIRLVYGSSLSPLDVVRTKVYNQNSLSWTDEAQTTQSSSPIQYTVNVISPVDSEEFIATLSNDGVNPTLSLLRWTSGQWVKDWFSSSLPVSTVSEKKTFDMAVEKVSGDILVVYSDGSAIPKYRTYTAGSGAWSGELPVFGAAPGSGDVSFIELESKPGSNEVALVYSDLNSDIFGSIWSGSSWNGGATATFTTTMDYVHSKGFDAAYETNSGNLLVAFGINTVDGFSYRKWDGVWSATNTVTYGADAEPRYLDLESSPVDNRIAVASIQDDSWLHVGMWNGQTFIHNIRREYSNQPIYGHLVVKISWLNDGSQAVVVYDDQSAENVLNWVKYESSWLLQSDLGFSQLGATESIQAYSYPHQNKLLYFISDSSKALYGFNYDGTTWSALNSGNSFASLYHNNSFSFDVRRKHDLLVTEHRTGQVSDNFTEKGVETNARLLAFQLKPTAGTSVTVNSLVVHVSEVNGLVDGDFTNVRIMVDDNSDGEISVSETTQVGGVGVVNLASGNITFSTPIVFTEKKDFILLSDLNTLSQFDKLKLSLSSNQITMGSSHILLGETSTSEHSEGARANLAEDDMRIIYGSKASQPELARTRIWSQSNLSYSNERLVMNGSGNVKWTINKVSPSGQEEFFGVLSEVGSGSNLSIYGVQSTNIVMELSSQALSNTATEKRAFDLEFSNSSGNALVVYSRGDEMPIFHTSNAGSWTTAANVFTTAPSSNPIEWVELVAKPGSDEIILLYADTTRDLFCVFWNGSAWDQASVQTINTNLYTTNGKCFDAAYESVHGDLLIVYGSGSYNGLRYITRDAITGTWGPARTYRADSPVIAGYQFLVDLEADPASNFIACVTYENGNDLQGYMWNGENFSDNDELNGNIGTFSNGDFFIDSEWVANSQKLLLAYRANTATNTLSTYSWSKRSSWIQENNTTLEGLDAVQSIQMKSLGLSEKVVLLISDTDELYSMLYQNSDWTALNNSNALETQLSANTTVPFSLSTRSPAKLLLSDHRIGQKIDQIATTSSLVSANLFAFTLNYKNCSSVNIQSIQISLSDITGIDSGNCSNFYLAVDDNHDGVVSASETTRYSGNTTITISGTSGSIQLATPFSVNNQTSYVVMGSIDGLVQGDQITMSLNATGIQTQTSLLKWGEASNVTHVFNTPIVYNTGDLLLSFNTKNSPLYHSRTQYYSSSNNSWSESTISAQGNANPNYILSSSDLSSDNVVLVTQGDTNVSGQLSLNTFSSNLWSNTSISDNIFYYDVFKRGFDLCSESLSGVKLYVYSNGDNILKYRSFNSGIWTSEANVLTSSIGTGAIEWVKMAAQPSSNTIALVYSDTNRDLFGLIWNGSQWVQNSHQLFSLSLEQINRRNFDVAYESLSGDLLVAWGDTNIDPVRYALMPFGSTTFSDNQTLAYAGDNDIYCMRLSPDPASDKIAIVMNVVNDELTAGMWMGSSFASMGLYDNNMTIGGVGDDYIAVSWIGSTGNAICVYEDDDLSNNEVSGQFAWMLWNEATGWVVQSNESFPKLSTLESIQLLSSVQNNSGNSVHAFFADTSANLFHSVYSNGTWISQNNGNELFSGLASIHGVPFYAEVKPEQTVLLTEHSLGQKNNGLSGSGNAYNTELLSFRLKKTKGSTTLTVNQIDILLTKVVGLDNTMLGNIHLYLDTDNSGSINTGDVIASSNAIASFQSSTGSFSFTEDFQIVSDNNYILQADFNRLGSGNAFDIGLESSHITITEQIAVLGDLSGVSHIELSVAPSPTNINDARLLYGTSASPNNNPRSRIWDANSQTWSVVWQTTGTTGLKQYIDHDFSPISTTEEIAVSLTDTGSGFVLDAMRWDGNDWVHDLAQAVNKYDSNKRKFYDFSYESISGNALLVYGDGDTNPRFMQYFASSNTWSPSTNVFLTAPGTGSVEWVRLASQPGDDKIALVYADSLNDLYGVIWSGNQWKEADTERFFEASLRTITQRPFDIAYERLSGDLLIAWSRNTTQAHMYATMSSNSLSWSDNLIDTQNANNIPHFVRLISDSRTDRIALVYKPYSDDLESAIWSGNGFHSSRERDNAIDNSLFKGQEHVDAAWMYNGNLFVNYRDAGESAYLSFTKYENSFSTAYSWSVLTDIEVPGFGEALNRQMTAYSNSNQFLIATHDSLNDLVVTHYNNLKWTVTNEGEALEKDLSETDGKPYVLSLREPKQIFISDHTVGHSGNQLQQLGSNSNVILAKFGLKAYRGSSNINSLQFKLSGVQSLTQGDFSNVLIYHDENSNGLIDGSETTLFGNGSVSINNNIGSIQFSQLESISKTKNLILQANVASVVSGSSFVLTMDNTMLSSVEAEIRGRIDSVRHSFYEKGVSDNYEDTIVFYSDFERPEHQLNYFIVAGNSLTISDNLKTDYSGASVKYIEHAYSKVTENQFLLTYAADYYDSNAFTMQNYIDGKWSHAWSFTTIDFQNQLIREAIDVTTESLSGNAMACYHVNGSTDVGYRYYNGSSWSQHQTVFSGNSISNEARFVLLRSNPKNNEIALVYADADNDLYCVLWDGTSWNSGNVQEVETALRLNNVRCFDASYESISGDLLVGWGKNGNNGLRYIQKQHDGNWGTVSVANWTYAYQPYFVEFDSDPVSNKIALVTCMNNWLQCATWTGDGFSAGTRLIQAGYSAYDMNFDVSFIGTTGNAIAVFDRNNLTNTLSSAYYTPDTGWNLLNEVLDQPFGNMESVRMTNIVRNDKVLALISDQNFDLYLAAFENSQWRLLNNNHPLTKELHGITNVPFELSTKPYDKVLWLAHDAGQKINNVGAGTNEDVELFLFSMHTSHQKTETINQMVFNLSNISGITVANLGNVQMRVDSDSDGVLDAGETTTLAGNATISMSGTSGNLVFNTNFTISGNTNYILIGDLKGIEANDSMSIELEKESLSISSNSIIHKNISGSQHIADPPHAVNEGEYFLSYASSASPSTTPKYRVYQPNTLTWTSEVLQESVGDTVYWVDSVLKRKSSEEITCTISDDGAESTLVINRYNGATLSKDFEVSGLPRSQNDRIFDLVQEDISGNTLLVYSNGSENPVYRYFNGSSWTITSNVFVTAPGTGIVEWIEITEKPGSNEIALVYTDSLRDLHAVIWSGNAWLESQSEITLETTIRDQNFKDFDAAYETFQGNLMVCWGRNGYNGMVWSQYANGVWSGPSTLTWTNAAQPRLVQLESDPVSDRIVFVDWDTSSRIQCGIWDGDKWKGFRYRDYANGAVNGDFNFDVSFIGTSGNALIVYNDQDVTGALHFITMISDSGEYRTDDDFILQSDYIVPGLSSIDSVKLFNDTKNERVYVMVSDVTQQVYGAYYDGLSFNILNNGNPLIDSLPSSFGLPFDFDIRQGLSLSIANHKDGQVQNLFSESLSGNGLLYKFSLMSQGGNILVDKLSISLTDITGVITNDLSSANLYWDTNENGLLDSSDIEVGGSANMNISVANKSGNIVFFNDIDVDQTKQFLVSANILNVGTNDIIKVAINNNDVVTKVALEKRNVSLGIYHQYSDLLPENMNDVRLVYGSSEMPTNHIRTSLFDSGTNAWQNVQLTTVVSAIPLHVQIEKSPLSHQESVMSFSEMGNTFHFDMLTFNGNQWSLDWTATDVSDPSANNAERVNSGFAYESISGNRLAVYAGDSGHLKYKYHNGVSWSSAANVFVTPPSSTQIEWLRMKAHPGKNDIVVAFSNADSDLFSVIWSDNVWMTSNVITHETELRTRNLRCFDLEYSSQSANLLLAWGKTGSDGIYYGTMANNNYYWNTPFTFTYTNDNTPYYLSLEAHSSSDNIGYVTVTDAQWLESAIWDGSSFVYGRRIDAMGLNNNGDENVALSWLNDGRAVIAYDDYDINDFVRWALYDGSTWTVQTNIGVTGDILGIESIKILPYGGGSQAMMILMDNNHRIFSFIYNGSNWTQFPSSGPSHFNGSDRRSRSFDFFVK